MNISGNAAIARKPSYSSPDHQISPQDREEATSLGADGYFRKPLDYEAYLKLGELVERCWSASSGNPAWTHRSPGCRHCTRSAPFVLRLRAAEGTVPAGVFEYGVLPSLARRFLAPQGRHALQATIFFGTDTTAPRASVVQRSWFSFLREAKTWLNRDRMQSISGEEFKNTVVLSDEFFAEVMAHPIPVDIEVVKNLGSAPGALDLFGWLAYRCFVAKGEERIPLFGEYGLTAQLGSVEYTRPRRFRAMLEELLAQVQAFWPVCPLTRQACQGTAATTIR